MAVNIETVDIFRKWMDKTEEVFRYEIGQRNIGITNELLESMKSKVIYLADGYVKGEFQFLTRGRFVDMGAGRGQRAVKGRGRRGSRGRKPKRWYSPTLYGRLNDLQGVVGHAIMEQAVHSVIGTIPKVV